MSYGTRNGGSRDAYFHFGFKKLCFIVPKIKKECKSVNVPLRVELYVDILRGTLTRSRSFSTVSFTLSLLISGNVCVCERER